MYSFGDLGVEYVCRDGGSGGGYSQKVVNINCLELETYCTYNIMIIIITNNPNNKI